MKAWTDYPFTELGDIAYQKAPVRRIDVLSYDQNKYCKVLVCGVLTEVKLGYVYENPCPLTEGARTLRKKRVAQLPRIVP